MKNVIFLVVCIAATEAYFNIRIEDQSPLWPRINGSESNIPESPSNPEGLEGLTENPDNEQVVFDPVVPPSSDVAGSAPAGWLCFLSNFL